MLGMEFSLHLVHLVFSLNPLLTFLLAQPNNCIDLEELNDMYIRYSTVYYPRGHSQITRCDQSIQGSNVLTLDARCIEGRLMTCDVLANRW